MLSLLIKMIKLDRSISGIKYKCTKCCINFDPSSPIHSDVRCRKCGSWINTFANTDSIYFGVYFNIDNNLYLIIFNGQSISISRVTCALSERFSIKSEILFSIDNFEDEFNAFISRIINNTCLS